MNDFIAKRDWGRMGISVYISLDTENYKAILKVSKSIEKARDVTRNYTGRNETEGEKDEIKH